MNMMKSFRYLKSSNAPRHGLLGWYSNSEATCGVTVVTVSCPISTRATSPNSSSSYTCPVYCTVLYCTWYCAVLYCAHLRHRHVGQVLKLLQSVHLYRERCQQNFVTVLIIFWEGPSPCWEFSWGSISLAVKLSLNSNRAWHLNTVDLW